MSINHKHSWVCKSPDNNKEIVCECCGIDFDKWQEIMKAKGYTCEEMRRFEN